MFIYRIGHTKKLHNTTVEEINIRTTHSKLRIQEHKILPTRKKVSKETTAELNLTREFLWGNHR